MLEPRSAGARTHTHTLFVVGAGGTTAVGMKLLTYVTYAVTTRRRDAVLTLAARSAPSVTPALQARAATCPRVDVTPSLAVAGEVTRLSPEALGAGQSYRKCQKHH